MQSELNKLRYPIGEFQKPAKFTDTILQDYITQIQTFPNLLKEAVKHLTEEQLNTPYRPKGWTVRQVVHHCSDSHMNAFIRHKLALTEDNPVIKPYHEDRWAELTDSKSMPIEPALYLLEGLHARWSVFLKELTQPDLDRTFIHPENNKVFTLAESIGLYAWHCNHHLTHVTNLKQRMGW